MTLKLPKPIQGYYQAANAHDSTQLSECFSEDAVVFDEGHEYHGVDEIKEWNQEITKRYALTLEILSAEEEDGQIRVTAMATGNFQGSPAALNSRFTVENHKITCLRCG